MELELPDDFKEFLTLLNEHGVEYLLIGGYAVGYHGYPRTTNDLDIWIAVHPENAERLAATLQTFGFPASDLYANIFLNEEDIVRMGVPPMRIEIIPSISGVDFETCYAERIVDTIDEIQIPIISLEHLKANKKSSGRFKDLDDLEHLP